MLRIVGKTYAVPSKLLERVAGDALSVVGTRGGEIELKFVSLAEIKRINSVYRGKNESTDVLSFVLDDKPLLGQIFICYTFTRSQAKRLGKSLNDEVALLLTHGILHIVGYDHEDEAESAKMQKIETEILRREGIAR